MLVLLPTTSPRGVSYRTRNSSPSLPTICHIHAFEVEISWQTLYVLRKELQIHICFGFGGEKKIKWNQCGRIWMNVVEIILKNLLKYITVKYAYSCLNHCEKQEFPATFLSCSHFHSRGAIIFKLFLNFCSYI